MNKATQFQNGFNILDMMDQSNCEVGLYFKRLFLPSSVTYMVWGIEISEGEEAFFCVGFEPNFRFMWWVGLLWLSNHVPVVAALLPTMNQTTMQLHKNRSRNFAPTASMPSVVGVLQNKP